ncbi:MAG: hypothetical protein KF752_11705 [Pirellulaceae bacterium]|nr:hypothetical protein [Pirellulaceae bacterium]
MMTWISVRISNLLFRLRSRRRVRSSPRIFAYFDGQRWRSIDPIEVIHALETHPKYLPAKHLQQAKNGNREAIEIIAGAVSDIFGVQPYADGRGLTIAERKSLLDTFYLYCQAVKKNIKPGSIAALSTDAT